jgi:SAM-dependent methyltransferase
VTGDASDGWDASAAAWIADQGERGDFGREHVLDTPMLERVRRGGFRTALDVGCGEGRFCRMLRDEGVRAVGLDPTAALLRRAKELDPGGDYRLGRVETLDPTLGAFDLVVSYLSLIDMPDLATAIDRMVAVLEPGGALLIANLTSFNTAANPDGWKDYGDGRLRLCIDNYLDERGDWVAWRGVRIVNWHRPLSAYMTLLLDHGLQLCHFSEPEPTGGDPKKVAHYRRAPWFHIMEWRKPS